LAGRGGPTHGSVPPCARFFYWCAMSLRFRYGPPPEGLPEWSEDLPKYEPCFFRFFPAIRSTIRIAATGCVLERPAVIPWDWNILNIVVQSRKSLEILVRLQWPNTRNPRVDICQPVLPVEPSRKLCDVVVCAHAKHDVATKVAEKFDGFMALGDPLRRLIDAARVAVFVLDWSDSVDHLAEAISMQCKIVSSDAGAAEEYLCQFAEPGTWRIVPDGKFEHYAAAVGDLLNGENKQPQIDVGDEAIWKPLTL